MRLAIPYRERLTVPFILSVILVGVGIFGFWPWPTMDMRTGKLALLELALLALCACLIKDRYLRLFALWTVFGVVMVYDWRSIVTCWRILLAALAIQAIQGRLSSQRVSGLILSWRILTVVHTAYMVLYQSIGLEPIFHKLIDQTILVVGFMDNTTIAGAYTAMTLPLFFDGKWKWFLIPSLVAIVATGSLGALIVGLVLCLCYIVDQAYKVLPKRVFASLCAMAIAISFLVPSGYLFLKKYETEKWGRRPVWHEVGRQMSENPKRVFVGYGPGQFGREFRVNASKQEEYPRYLLWEVAHNELIQSWYEFGAIGVFLLMMFLNRVWFVGKTIAECKTFFLIGVGWLMCALYTFPAHHAGLSFVGLLCIALIGSYENNRRLRCQTTQ